MPIAASTTRRQFRLGLALGSAAVLLAIAATGCDDELPGFARPPPSDAGVQDGGGDDLDAGADGVASQR
jgi:hypothetical protein